MHSKKTFFINHLYKSKEYTQYKKGKRSEFSYIYACFLTNHQGIPEDLTIRKLRHERHQTRGIDASSPSPSYVCFKQTMLILPRLVKFPTIDFIPVRNRDVD